MLGWLRQILVKPEEWSNILLKIETNKSIIYETLLKEIHSGISKELRLEVMKIFKKYCDFGSGDAPPYGPMFYRDIYRDTISLYKKMHPPPYEFPKWPYDIGGGEKRQKKHKRTLKKKGKKTYRKRKTNRKKRILKKSKKKSKKKYK